MNTHEVFRDTEKVLNTVNDDNFITQRKMIMEVWKQGARADRYEFNLKPSSAILGQVSVPWFLPY